MGKPTIIFSRKDYFENLALNCKFTILHKFINNMPQIPFRGASKITHEILSIFT